MLAVEYEGVEDGEEGGVPETHQILGGELQVGGELAGDLMDRVQEHQEHGVAQEFVLLALALLARQVVLEGQLEGRHKQGSSLPGCTPVSC